MMGPIRLPLVVFRTKGSFMYSNNVVLVKGRVSSEPWIRQLPSGSSIVNLEVTTAARRRVRGGLGADRRRSRIGATVRPATRSSWSGT